MPFQPVASSQEMGSPGTLTVTAGEPGKTFRIAQRLHHNEAIFQG